MKPVARSLPGLLCAALRPLPLAPLRPLLDALLGAVVRRHPRIFDRLGEHSEKRFGIEPTDLPFAFILEPRRDGPRATAVRRLPGAGLDARIVGPVLDLIGLANGTLDGDALFFSRDILVEGDVEAIVALRNAIDDAGVDLLRDSAAGLGVLGPALERALRIAGAAAEDLSSIAGARRWN
jgi:predicted lipid carrier protein YhbT